MYDVCVAYRRRSELKPTKFNISNHHHPFESCPPVRRMAITRKPKHVLDIDPDPDSDSDSHSSDIDLEKTVKKRFQEFI